MIEQDLTIPEAARRLSLSDKTLSNWVAKTRHGQLAKLNDTRKPVTDLEAKVSRLTRELSEARMERDILKKPTVGSSGACNSCLQYSRQCLKPPRLPWTLVQA